MVHYHLHRAGILSSGHVMRNKALKFAPMDAFEKILEYAVIPTFDLIIWFNYRGAILLKRRIAPYKNTWALPGLRMMKPERIEDTLVRIVKTEVCITVDPGTKRFIGQYVGRFRTEHNRQDLSTCYAVFSDAIDIAINQEHFSSYCFIKAKEDIPAKTGAMYRYYLNLFFEQNTF